MEDPDPMKRYFGTTVPTSIPESSSWWAHQAKDLFALTDQSEMGMMETMITITFNDFAPEMLASARTFVDHDSYVFFFNVFGFLFK